MKIAAISDVHVKKPNDEADRLLCRFLEHPEVLDSDIVLLLGDIFDLMCGPHEEYLKDFAHIFSKLRHLSRAGKKVYFFEGNHDVHLEKLFQDKWAEGEIIPLQQPLVLSLSGKSYYLSHGDEHDVENVSYQRYKRFILSRPLRFIAENVVPYRLLHFIGERASQFSRKKGSRSFDADKVRDKFRQGVIASTEGKYDFVLGGHSHVQDLYQLPGTNCTFVNNGYALKSKSFILIKQHRVHFESLL